MGRVTRQPMCDRLAELLNRLTFDPTAEPGPMAGSVATLLWPDERPGGDRYRPCHGRCHRTFQDLLRARVSFWEHERVPEHLQGLWDEARERCPRWPGFRRLVLDEVGRSQLEGVRRIDSAFHEALFRAADEVAVEFQEDGGYSYKYRFEFGDDIPGGGSA